MSRVPLPPTSGAIDSAPAKRPRVGVVVVDWNSGELVSRCLASLSEQSAAPDAVVVVDNASQNPTSHRVRARHPRVEIIRLPGNRGFAAACNLGITAVGDPEWIALVNPDAFPEPDWLEALLRAAAESPGYSSFASRLVCADDPERLDGTGDIYSVSGLAWRRDHTAPADGRHLERDEVFGPCAAAALYRRAALLEVGGLDEAFFCYFEDVDLSFRLQLAGHRCLYVPEAVARHVGSVTTVRHSDFSVYHAHRNLVWTFLKNMPMPLLALYAPHHLLLNALSIASFTLRGQGRTILRAKRDALRELPRVWRQRRAIQAARRARGRALRRLMVSGRRAFGIGRFRPQ
jgi:GT2 family glycosyltransferase